MHARFLARELTRIHTSVPGFPANGMAESWGDSVPTGPLWRHRHASRASERCPAGASVRADANTSPDADAHDLSLVAHILHTNAHRFAAIRWHSREASAIENPRTMGFSGPNNTKPHRLGECSSPPSDTSQWEMSQSQSPGENPTPVEREFQAGPLLGGLTHRPQLRTIRNQVDPDALGVPSGSPLRSFSPDLLGASDGLGTFPDMHETMSSAGGIAPTLLRRLAERPERNTRVVAKTISRMQPQIVVPRSADPAVLVDLHRDRRLSLQRLATENGVELADRYTVSALATGYIELAQTPTEPDPDGEFDTGIELRVDPRNQLRLTQGIAHQLAASHGD